MDAQTATAAATLAKTHNQAGGPPAFKARNVLICGMASTTIIAIEARALQDVLTVARSTTSLEDVDRFAVAVLGQNLASASLKFLVRISRKPLHRCDDLRLPLAGRTIP
jgi:hypothetical protein